MGHKYTHHDIQKELLHIITSNVLRVKVSTIREREFFSTMADEETDVRNIEQLSFCVRFLDDNLDVSEDFIGFQEFYNIKRETIVNATKNILLSCQLNLDNCCG